MKERCFKTCLQYGRRWEIGEEREVDKFDENGQPIISTHFRLATSSDAPPKTVEFKTPQQEAQEQYALLRGDRTFAIRKALEALDPELNSDWNVKGFPSIQRVHALTGQIELQRADIVEAWPEFDREFARSLRG